MSIRLLSLAFGTLSTQDEASPPERAESSSVSALLSSTRDVFRSDEDLAQQLQAGNADALGLLFNRHSTLLFRIARRILRNDAEAAEDAVQQIFLDVFRAIDQFSSDRGEFKPWLLMFAYHRTLNQRRSLLAARFFDTDPLTDLLPELLRRAQQRARQPDSRMLIDQILGALEPRQRRTIELTYYEGFTAEEIAERTGETVRVVRHNLYRGLAQLRKSVAASERRMPNGRA